MTDQNAFALHLPRGHRTPLVLDSPHSGNEYPVDFGAAVPMSALRNAEDSHVDALFGAAPDRGATFLVANFPRSYIDPNRSLLDIDTSLLEGAWPGPAVASRKTELGVGLIWRLLDTGEPIYARKLTIAEVKRRIVEYHQPYQKALKEALDETHAHFGAVWHLNCHSMPAVSGRISEEGPGRPRADFVLGDRDGTTCSHEFTQFVKSALEGLGYQVKVNDPYKGVELVRAFSDPGAGRHSLQIEVNRRLYMNEETREPTDAFPDLKRDLDRFLDRLAGFAAEHGSHACTDDGHHHHHDGDHGQHRQGHGAQGHEHSQAHGSKHRH